LDSNAEKEVKKAIVASGYKVLDKKKKIKKYNYNKVIRFVFALLIVLLLILIFVKLDLNRYLTDLSSTTIV